MSSWFKFKSLVLGMALKLNNSVANVLKLKVIKFCWLILTFVEVTEEKLVRDIFDPLILNRVTMFPFNNDSK